jgi:Spy/CpxP family protein refolding chaperone
MYTAMKWALTLIVPAVLVMPASAQDHAVPEGTTVKLLLLRQKSVQEELKLSGEQKTKIHDFTHKQHEAFLETRKLGEAERRQKHHALGQENAAFLKDTLNAGQSKRLDQIALQFTALHHLTTPAMARELNLSEQQVQQFHDLQKESRKALANALHGKDAEARTKNVAHLREETRTKILAILNDQQKAKARQLAGDPFVGAIIIEEPE